jgi:hypothetical protein
MSYSLFPQLAQVGSSTVRARTCAALVLLAALGLASACNDDGGPSPSDDMSQAGNGGEATGGNGTGGTGTGGTGTGGTGTGGLGEGGEGGKVGGCGSLQVECDGECFYFETDEGHCGSCTNECDEGQMCTSGICQPKGPQSIFSGFAGEFADLRLAIDDDGDAVLLWVHVDDDRTLYANTFDAKSETWSAPEKLAPGVQYPQLALDVQGNAVALWPKYDGTQYDVLLARLNKAKATWSEPELVEGEGQNALLPELAVAGTGEITVQWEQLLEGGASELVARRSNADGRFTSDPITVVPSVKTHEVASGRGGETYSAWVTWGDDNVLLSRWDGSAWSEPDTVSQGDGHAFAGHPQLFIDDDGNVTVIINRNVTNASPSAAWVTASQYRNGAWSENQYVSDGYNAYYAWSAQAANGDVFVAWNEQSTPSFVPYACGARLDGGAGTWSEPHCFETGSSALSSSPRFIVDNAGGALLLVSWPHTVGQDFYAARWSAEDDTLSAPEPFPADEDAPAPVLLVYGRNGQGLALFLDLGAKESFINWEKL